MRLRRRLKRRFTVSFLMGLIAIASVGFWSLSMWQRSLPPRVHRTLSTGVRIVASREVTDSLWMPTERELLRRADRAEIIQIPFTDVDLARLSVQINPETLILVGTKVTDTGMAHLKRMTELQWLDLQDSQVTDAGLRVLTGMPRLRGVALRGARVTPAAVAELRRIAPNMRIID
jgi:hypothetical protein